ncbi:MAG TPA: hypothetical protein VGW40_13640 [Allosphingosinicella sp.]|nr:hypothetical protein [Allosphingosinicella sp.]
MNAALRAEGQRTIIIGDRAALRNDASRASGLRVNRWVNTFTSNDDGSLGYNLEGDRPSGEASTRVCVAGKFTNIRLYDARRPGTPPGARRGGAFDAMLADQEALGIRPMLQAESISTGPNGEVRRGNGVTLQGSVTQRSGMLFVNRAGGTAESLYLMQNVAYTPAGLERLN